MPNRIIKESIRTSKKINNLTDFQFRLWLYLITYVDDFGRGSADPELLKGFVFPRRKRVSESDIEKALAELAGMGCILLYEVDGESYFCFPNWSKHQRIQTKQSKFPEPVNCPEPQTFSASHGASPCVTVGHGEPPLESESNPNPNPNSNPKESAPARHAHGQYEWVKLSDDEYAHLLANLGEKELARCIAYVDEAAQSTGNKNKWKDWNLVIRKCHRDGWGLAGLKGRNAPASREYNFTADDFAKISGIDPNNI